MCVFLCTENRKGCMKDKQRICKEVGGEEKEGNKINMFWNISGWGKETRKMESRGIMEDSKGGVWLTTECHEWMWECHIIKVTALFKC